MDVEIDGSGTVYLVRPVSPDAKAWVTDRVEVPDYATPGAFPVEHRYIENLTHGMIEEGFSVCVNGQEAFIGSDGSVCLRNTSDAT